MDDFSSFTKKSSINFSPKSDFLDDFADRFLFLFGTFLVLVMVKKLFTIFCLLLLDKHLNFSLDSFS